MPSINYLHQLQEPSLPPPNACQACWAMFFSRFHLQISYHPVSKNSCTDALSYTFNPQKEQHSTEPILPDSLFVCPIQWSYITSANSLNARLPGFPLSRLYVSLPQCNNIIQSVHPGANTTLSRVNECFWLSGMAADVRQFIQESRECAIFKNA